MQALSGPLIMLATQASSSSPIGPAAHCTSGTVTEPAVKADSGSPSRSLVPAVRSFPTKDTVENSGDLPVTICVQDQYGSPYILSIGPSDSTPQPVASESPIILVIPDADDVPIETSLQASSGLSNTLTTTNSSIAEPDSQGGGESTTHQNDS